MSGPVKPKRKNSEKRKEKSREAARCRRGHETEIFCDLAHHLPVSYSLLSQLDKASIIRLSIAHVKLRTLFANENLFKYSSDEDVSQKIDQQFYKSLDGFVLVLEQRGDIIYVSENIDKYLGIAQVDIMGHDILDFIHPCDHDELRDLVSDPCQAEQRRMVFLRMKCTLTNTGRNINIKSAGYKVITLSGSSLNTTCLTDDSDSYGYSYTVLIGRPIADLVHSELALDEVTFVTRLSMDLRFIYCDKEVLDLLGYTSGDLIGKSLYQFHHVYDAELLDKAYRSLYVKGQTMTGLYRFMAKKGGYVWLDTQAAIIGDAHTERSRSILCISHVVSDIECENEILAEVQFNNHESIMEEDAGEYVIIEDDEDEVILYENDPEEEDVTYGCKIHLVTEKLLASQVLPYLNLSPPASCSSSDSDVTAVNSPIIVDVTTAQTQLDYDQLKEGLEEVTETELETMPVLDDLLDDLDCGLNMRAPYIPMNDTFFSMQMPSSENVTIDVSPMDFSNSPLITTSAIDMDTLNLLLNQFIDSTKKSTQQAASVEPTIEASAASKSHDDLNEQWLEPVLPTISYKPVKIDNRVRVINGANNRTVAPHNQSVGSTDGSSVLRNLLTEGIDTHFGYCLSRPLRLRNENISSGGGRVNNTTTPQSSPSQMRSGLLSHLIGSSSRAKGSAAASYLADYNVRTATM